MSAHWAKRLGMGAIVVFSVSLLTILFNFLGTITAAAVLGMMLGAAREWRRQAVTLSLVFPIVIMGLSEFSRSALEPGKRISLSLLCFGVFWATYLITVALVHFERESESVASAPGLIAPLPSPEPKPPVLPAECPTLDQLAGTWYQQTAMPGGQRAGKRIEVRGNRLALIVVDDDGRIKASSTGRLQLTPEAGLFPKQNTTSDGQLLESGRS